MDSRNLIIFLSALWIQKPHLLFGRFVDHHPFDDPDYFLDDIKDVDPVKNLLSAKFHNDNLTFTIQHKDNRTLTAMLEDGDDCIYKGFMMGCSTSRVLVTGCLGTVQSVQIESRVFGDMVFTTHDGIVLPVETFGGVRGKRAADWDVDYYDDIDDTIENPDFELEFADLAEAEVDDLPTPPKKLQLNLNVYLDINWNLEFGRTGGKGWAKRILAHAHGLLSHESLKTKIDLITDSDKFFTSKQHILPGKTAFNKKLPKLMTGPATVNGDQTTAHLYLTAAGEERPRLLGLSEGSAMCKASYDIPRTMVVYKTSEIRTGMTVAHEIAHLLGVEHDFINGKRNKQCGKGKVTGEYVMNYGDNRQKWSECSNTDFEVYYQRVSLERETFCLKEAVTGCACSGFKDTLGYGDNCKGVVPWCYVHEDAGCAEMKKFYGKWISETPCSPPTPKCACNGQKDGLGYGGNCDSPVPWCYVDENADCDDYKEFYGKWISESPCTNNTPKPQTTTTRRTTRRTTRQTTKRTTPRPTTRRSTRRTTTQRTTRRTTTRRTTKRTTTRKTPTQYGSSPCKYTCGASGSCTSKYIGEPRAGSVSGSCLPKSFGGRCFGIPSDCKDCNSELNCPE